jgi:hypothetical protein
MPVHHQAISAVLRRSRRLSAALPIGLTACAVNAPAAGAAYVIPQASTSCHGGLTRAATSDEPNLLAYKFSCSNEITAYTVTVNRTLSDFSAADDFSTTATVVDAQGNLVPTESFGCEGTIPGAGFNCNGDATPGHFVEGTFDTSDPYCGGVPAGAPKGARPLPQALVQLIVSDKTGAENGPFRLNISPACPKPKVTHHKKKHKHKGKKKHGK